MADNINNYLLALERGISLVREDVAHFYVPDYITVCPVFGFDTSSKDACLADILDQGEEIFASIKFRRTKRLSKRLEAVLSDIPGTEGIAQDLLLRKNVRGTVHGYVLDSDVAARVIYRLIQEPKKLKKYFKRGVTNFMSEKSAPSAAYLSRIYDSHTFSRELDFNDIERKRRQRTQEIMDRIEREREEDTRRTIRNIYNSI